MSNDPERAADGSDDSSMDEEEQKALTIKFNSQQHGILTALSRMNVFNVEVRNFPSHLFQKLMKFLIF